MTKTEEIQEQTGRVVKIHRKNAARDFPHRQPGTAISVQTPSGEIQEGRVIASLRSFRERQRRALQHHHVRDSHQQRDTREGVEKPGESPGKERRGEIPRRPGAPSTPHEGARRANIMKRGTAPATWKRQETQEMQYAGWTNRDNRSFTISFDDTEVGVAHDAGTTPTWKPPRTPWNAAGRGANDARERAGAGTDRPARLAGTTPAASNPGKTAKRQKEGAGAQEKAKP